MQIKPMSILRKNHQISLKRQYGSNHIVLRPKCVRNTGENKVQIKSNKFFVKMIKIPLKVNMNWILLPFNQFIEGNWKDITYETIRAVRKEQNSLKRQYKSNLSFGFWIKFSKKTIWVEPFCLLIRIPGKGNMSWTILLFDQNSLKDNMSGNVLSFDQNLFVSIEKTTGIILAFLKNW